MCPVLCVPRRAHNGNPVPCGQGSCNAHDWGNNSWAPDMLLYKAHWSTLGVYRGGVQQHPTLLSCLHVALSRASTWHSLVPPRGTLLCLHVHTHHSTHQWVGTCQYPMHCIAVLHCARPSNCLAPALGTLQVTRLVSTASSRAGAWWPRCPVSTLSGLGSRWVWWCTPPRGPPTRRTIRTWLFFWMPGGCWAALHNSENCSSGPSTESL